MDAELKAKWVAALRSGEYKQGKGALHRADGKFCCLGVLCDIANPAGWHEMNATTGEFGFDGYFQTLPPSMSKHVERRHECHLIDMNDDGESFATIAGYIESHM